MNQNLTSRNNILKIKLISFCGSGIRSEHEVRKKLSALKSKLNASKENNSEGGISFEESLITFLIESKLVLKDDDYIDLYLSNLSSKKGYSYIKLYSLLVKKVSNSHTLTSKIKRFMITNEEKEIEKIINKNMKKLSLIQKEARINFLTNRGFSFEKSKSVLKNMSLL